MTTNADAIAHALQTEQFARAHRDQVERDIQQRMFDLANGAVKEAPRTVIMMIEMRTNGTEEQCHKTIEKLKKEIALQGFDVTISDVHIYGGE